MHLPAFMVIYRKHHPVSPSLKLTLVYVDMIFLFRFGYSTPFVTVNRLNAILNCASHIFQHCLQHCWNISIYLLHIFRKKLAANRIRLFRSARLTERLIHLGRLVETNKHKRERWRRVRGAGISAWARSLSPWLENRWQAPLSCRRDEIRYFVKVISPRKVSFRRVIASAPFLPTAAALHATRAREEQRKEESKVRGKGPSRRQVGWYCRKRRRTSGIAAGESRAEVKDRSVTLIEGKLHSHLSTVDPLLSSPSTILRCLF